MSTCPRCGGSDCIEIHITLHDEDDIRFTSCRECETKWWERDGAAVSLDEVLDRAGRRDAG